MNKSFVYIVIALCCVAMTACLDDDNNYNYDKLNELQGGYQSFGGLKDDYSISVDEKLTLTPTFKFTIDSIAPDVSYEWYLDGQLLANEHDVSYTFSSSKSGTVKITFAVIDNKSGVKFAKTTTVKIRTEFQRGWAILSKGADNRSILNFIIPSTLTYSIILDGEEVIRDSLVYHRVKMDVTPNLGMNPIGLMENLGDMDYYSSKGIEVYDELLVKQDKWAELNGNTLEREVYTFEEFNNDLPDNFSPVEAAMTYSAKLLRNEDGSIFLNNKIDIADFHSGFYTSIPLNNGMKFRRLFQNFKLNDLYNNVIPALKEDNTLVGIYDAGISVDDYSTTISENSTKLTGNVYEITEMNGQKHFQKMSQEVIDIILATSTRKNDYDVSAAVSAWVALMKEPSSSSYGLKYFSLKGEEAEAAATISETEYFEKELGAISNYRDIAVFNNKMFVVIADGNKLWYCQYGKDPDTGTNHNEPMLLLGEMASDVVSLAVNDLSASPALPGYNGQLGVALADGTFSIYEVKEVKNQSTGVCEKVALGKLFPNEVIEDNHFGNIVDALYKIGRGFDYFWFEF